MATTWDWQELSAELIRALRGKRSQVALSRRLGFKSNVVYTWESGRRDPGATELFRLLCLVKVKPETAWASFAVRVVDLNLEEKEGLAALICRLRGGARISEIARRCGVSRFVASRWFSGKTEPRLAEFLSLLEALTLRVSDFVAMLVEPASMPVFAARWAELSVRRDVAYSHPWSQAILRQLETSDYARARGDTVPWLARRLGIKGASVRQSVDALIAAGLIEFVGRRYRTRPMALDTSLASDEQRRSLKLHWADVGRTRIEEGKAGLYSWAVVGLSREDFERLTEMHVKYLRSLRQLVDNSAPVEVVAVANVQLFRFP